MPWLRVTALVLLVVGSSCVAEAAPAAVPVTWSAHAARRFWTPERMRRAKPVEAVSQTQAGFASPVSEGARGGGRVIAPLGPAGGATGSSFDEVADPTQPPYRVNGVVFLDTPFGPGRCSGTSVRAPNFSVVLTAAHCVREGGRFGRWARGSWVFVPGYRYGQRPFGLFPAKWLDTTLSWQTTGSSNFDVAAAVVRKNERGERLADAVGGDGIAWGLRPKQTFDVHGYPVGAPFDGATQRICAATPFLGRSPESFYSVGPPNLAVSCNVSGGASGGGWTIRGNVLNSVTSLGYPEDPATVYGPYFGREVARLYGRAARVR